MDDVIDKMDHILCEIYDKQSFISLHEIQDTKDQILELQCLKKSVLGQDNE